MIRCEDGFLKGLCERPECPHFAGVHKRGASVGRSCLICGGPTTKKHCTVHSKSRSAIERDLRKRMAGRHA
jgi:hypothetical protein